MKISSIRIKNFRRFHSLAIQNIPPARLVVLAGPNGCGKSSLFDAFIIFHRLKAFGQSVWDDLYHGRDPSIQGFGDLIEIEGDRPLTKKSFYLRSAYRNDPDIQFNGLPKLGDPVETGRNTNRMMDTDGVVANNYQRLAADAFAEAFDTADGGVTLNQFRQNVIGQIAAWINRLFPDLTLDSLGNPLQHGTFSFSKGSVKGFRFKNLSGGEKAAFDLLLDMIVKRKDFNDTVFAIDEPESHMNTRLQGALLEELYSLVPDGSQLWLATHSIGMMRKAKELYKRHPGEIIFLDFEGHDYDGHVDLVPIEPTRAFWERALRISLDDLSDLIAPKEIVICEGNPNTVTLSKNAQHDARCYEKIFEDVYPDVKFISAGNSSEVSSDRLKFASVFPILVSGIRVRRVIDRDDHEPTRVAEFRRGNVNVLRRRHLESYLYDKEVFRALYARESREADFAAFETRYDAAIAASVGRGHPVDDVKSAASDIYTDAKRDLKLTGCGNDQMSFARTVLCPLIKPTMSVYKELHEDIFGD